MIINRGLFTSNNANTVLHKSAKSTLELLAETINSMDMTLYNEIIIECGDNESLESDVISVSNKPKPVTDESYKYDGLIHKINAVPKDEGVLTISYHLCPEFDRVHLFYGQRPQQLGTRITEDNLSKVMEILFNNDDGDYKEEHKRGYDIDIEPVSVHNMLYIPQTPENFTKMAIEKDYFVEDFESDRQLFYYLKHRCRMHAINKSLKKYSLAKDGKEILIFPTDLMSKSDGVAVYLCAIQNDKYSVDGNKNKKIEKWQMSEFFTTAAKIKEKYGIESCDLSSCLNPKLRKRYLKIDINELMKRKDNFPINSSKLTTIRTSKTNKEKVHQIKKSQLFEALKTSNDKKYFRPIISFKDSKSAYCVDIVLMVDIGSNNWIGVVFRIDEDRNGDDNGNTYNYRPVCIAVDCVDIRNKATLFQAINFKDDNDGYQWIKNDNIGKLVIINDTDIDQEQIEKLRQQLEESKNESMEWQNKYIESQKSNKQLVAENNQLMTENYNLKSQNNELAEINDYYFQHVALNPNCNIAPHLKHTLYTMYPTIIGYPVDITNVDLQQNDDQKQKK